ncbi:hypothetical protein G3N18_10160 [Microbacterium sp. 2C]|uniref:Rv0909 family putative TA system antitoxin n=1 Tax=Microbacterium paulum TaxID=2707006 RepID=UPI0018C24350|nr:Rv0909 family putative TA system antitoxin [Microbacterium paulum]MBG0718422.1 hypothetical protein [Microbacterium paulum]
MADDDVAGKAKSAFEDIKGKVSDALDSPQAEQVSDSVLDSVADFAKKILPDEYDAKIDEVRNHVDGAIGTEK